MAVRIRLATARDGEAVAAIYRPVVAETAISFETTPPDQEEMARRIDETLQSYPWLVCDIDGLTAGYAYAARHRVRGAYQWSVDTSVYIADAYRRVGYRLDRWHDVGWWQLMLRQHQGSPSAPLDVAAVSSLPGWTELLKLGESAIRAEAA